MGVEIESDSCLFLFIQLGESRVLFPWMEIWFRLLLHLMICLTCDSWLLPFLITVVIVDSIPGDSDLAEPINADADGSLERSF